MNQSVIRTMTDIRNLKKSCWPFVSRNLTNVNARNKMNPRVDVSTTWNRLIGPPSYQRSYRGQTIRNSRIFRSKMVTSVVVSRKPKSSPLQDAIISSRECRSTTSKIDRKEEELSVGSNSALSHCNVHKSKLFHVINEDKIIDSNANTLISNDRVYKNLEHNLRQNECVEHGRTFSSKAYSSNQTSFCTNVNKVFHNRRPADVNEENCTTVLNHHKFDIYSNTIRLVTSDTKFPVASSQVIQSDTHLQSDEASQSSIIYIGSYFNDRETKCNDFVLNVSKDPCSDGRMNMSALELLGHSTCVSTSGSSVHSLESQNSDSLYNSSSSVNSGEGNKEITMNDIDDISDTDEIIDLECRNVKVKPFEDDCIEGSDNDDCLESSDNDDDCIEISDNDDDCIEGKDNDSIEIGDDENNDDVATDGIKTSDDYDADDILNESLDYSEE